MSHAFASASRITAGALLVATLVTCRYDPVPDAIIDGLGDEAGEPSATHRGGQPCLAFWVEKSKWDDVAFPLRVRAGDRRMRSLVGRDGSCGSCHRLPDDGAIDDITGASRSSAGVVVVAESDLGSSCKVEEPTGSGGGATTTTTVGSGGAGGQGGGGGN